MLLLLPAILFSLFTTLFLRSVKKCRASLIEVNRRHEIWQKSFGTYARERYLMANNHFSLQVSIALVWFSGSFIAGAFIIVIMKKYS